MNVSTSVLLCKTSCLTLKSSRHFRFKLTGICFGFFLSCKTKGFFFGCFIFPNRLGKVAVFIRCLAEDETFVLENFAVTLAIRHYMYAVCVYDMDINRIFVWR